MSGGEFPIVLLPGLHGSVRLFDPLVGRLREHLGPRDFLPLPLPARGSQDYGTLREHFETRLERQGPLVLVAESFSGPLAMGLAASPRLRVERLVLAASYGGPPLGAGWSLLPLRPLLALRPPRPAIRHFLAGDLASEALVESVRTEIEAAGSKLLTARIRAAMDLEPADYPSPEGVPTLLLQARRDAILGWEVQSALERHLPAAEVNWIDAPHLLLQAAPDRSAKAIAGFLDPGA